MEDPQTVTNPLDEESLGAATEDKVAKKKKKKKKAKEESGSGDATKKLTKKKSSSKLSSSMHSEGTEDPASNSSPRPKSLKKATSSRSVKSSSSKQKKKKTKSSPSSPGKVKAEEETYEEKVRRKEKEWANPKKTPQDAAAAPTPPENESYEDKVRRKEKEWSKPKKSTKAPPQDAVKPTSLRAAQSAPAEESYDAKIRRKNEWANSKKGPEPVVEPTSIKAVQSGPVGPVAGAHHAGPNAPNLNQTHNMVPLMSSTSSAGPPRVSTILRDGFEDEFEVRTAPAAPVRNTSRNVSGAAGMNANSDDGDPPDAQSTDGNVTITPDGEYLITATLVPDNSERPSLDEDEDDLESEQTPDDHQTAASTTVMLVEAKQMQKPRYWAWIAAIAIIFLAVLLAVVLALTVSGGGSGGSSSSNAKNGGAPTPTVAPTSPQVTAPSPSPTDRPSQEKLPTLQPFIDGGFQPSVDVPTVSQPSSFTGGTPISGDSMYSVFVVQWAYTIEGFCDSFEGTPQLYLDCPGSNAFVDYLDFDWNVHCEYDENGLSYRLRCYPIDDQLFDPVADFPAEYTTTIIATCVDSEQQSTMTTWTTGNQGTGCGESDGGEFYGATSSALTIGSACIHSDTPQGLGDITYQPAAFAEPCATLPISVAGGNGIEMDACGAFDECVEATKCSMGMDSISLSVQNTDPDCKISIDSFPSEDQLQVYADLVWDVADPHLVSDFSGMAHAALEAAQDGEE